MSTYMEYLFDEGYIDLSTITLTEENKEEGQSIAKRLGVRFVGWWDDLKKYIFNDDNVTESSFTADNFEEAEKKLKKIRLRFANA